MGCSATWRIAVDQLIITSDGVPDNVYHGREFGHLQSSREELHRMAGQVFCKIQGCRVELFDRRRPHNAFQLYSLCRHRKSARSAAEACRGVSRAHGPSLEPSCLEFRLDGGEASPWVVSNSSRLLDHQFVRTASPWTDRVSSSGVPQPDGAALPPLQVTVLWRARFNFVGISSAERGSSAASNRLVKD